MSSHLPVWINRTYRLELSVLKSGQNQRELRCIPDFFCLPYYNTFLHPAHDACCFHVHLSFLFNVERWYYLQEKAKYAKKMPLFHVKQRHLMFGSLRPRRISIRRADHSDRSGSFTRLLSSKVFQARIVSGDSPLSTYRPGLRQQRLHQRRDRACQQPGSQWSAHRRPRRRR